MTNFDLPEFKKKLRDILEIPEVRFVGIIDKNGKLIIGKFKEDKERLLTDFQQIQVYQELSARVTTRKHFDSELGRVKYSSSRREKVVILSFPISEKILMVSADPNVNIDRIAFSIIKKLGKEWYFFYGL